MKGPWYISAQAVRDYLRIRGRVENEQNFETATGELIQIAAEIVASGKEATLTSSGYLRYRTGRKYGRMGLVVSAAPRVEGDLPQLVGATRSVK